jgi:uncharacterized iron-regulated membrane protein
MLAWGVSGFQLGFPRQMDSFVTWLNGDPENFQRPAILQFFRTLHFARIGEGPLARWSWILVSFVPALLFVSGLIVWWRRVVMRKLRTGVPSQAATASAVQSR